MRIHLIFMIAFLLILPMTLAQEEGNPVWLTENGVRVTGYYPSQLSSIFSSVEESGTKLHLKFTSRGTEREFGYATGLVTSPATNTVSIVNGEIEFPEGYAFSCASPNCKISMRLDAGGLDYVNMTGTGKIIYRKPGEMSAGTDAIISGMYEIRASTQGRQEKINITANTGRQEGSFGEINISSKGKIELQKWKENSDIYYAISSKEPADIYSPLFTNVRVVSGLSEQDTRRGHITNMNYGDAVAVQMQAANLFFSGVPNLYEKCKSPESDSYNPLGSCLLVDPALKRITAWASRETEYEDENGNKNYKGTELRLMFPAELDYNNLKVDKFIPPSGEGKILVEREGVSGTSLGFSSKKLSVEGGSWFDPRISFEAELFDSFISEYTLISCNAETKECFLGADRTRVIGGPTAVNPLSTWGNSNVDPSIRCNSDSDCPENRFCDIEITKKCIIKAQCRKIGGVSGTGRGIDIVFAGVGFSSESTLRAMAEQAANRLLQISPFKEYKDKFTFWALTAPPSYIPSNARQLKLQCPQSEIVIILSQYGLGSHLAGGGGGGSASEFGAASVLVGGTSMIYMDQMKFVHELGHTLGLADEYNIYGEYLNKEDPRIARYIERLSLSPETGLPDSSPNCLRYESAKAVWETLLGGGKGIALAEEARKKQWTGCIAVEPFCDETNPDYQNACGNFLRAGRDSIMTGNTQISIGQEFNDVSKAWLVRLFTR